MDTIIKRNIVRGAGSLMDIYPVKGKYTITTYLPHRNDSNQLKDDWNKVGQTLLKVIATNKNAKK